MGQIKNIKLHIVTDIKVIEWHTQTYRQTATSTMSPPSKCTPLCLLLLLLVSAYAKHTDKRHAHHLKQLKQKRDIDDLRNDPLLTSIFKSDIQEKRADRS